MNQKILSQDACFPGRNDISFPLTANYMAVDRLFRPDAISRMIYFTTIHHINLCISNSDFLYGADIYSHPKGERLLPKLESQVFGPAGKPSSNNYLLDKTKTLRYLQ